MRIRKRYRNPLPTIDLSYPLPPSTAAVGVAGAVVETPVAAARGTTGGKEGEAMAAAKAVARVSESRWGDGGLHPNGRTTNPTPCLPFYLQPSEAAAAGAADRGDLLPAPRSPLLATRDVLFYRGDGREVPRREERGGDVGWDAHGGDNTPPKSLGAKASQVSVGHGGHAVPPCSTAAALTAAEAMVKWSDEAEELSPKKGREGYHAARGRTLGLEEEKEEDNVVAEREMKQPAPSKSRIRRTAASCTPTMVAPAGNTLLTFAGIGNIGGAPTATADSAGARKRCDDMVVNEEGGEVVPAAIASLVDGNSSGGNGNGNGNGNGKKRRSPAVLMEGSRCSRVNGRGWRCCQQTLVGYSQCEHHLGKARLRSVSSVRCNVRARKKDDVDGAALPPAPPLLQQQDQLLIRHEEDEEEEKPTKQRRNKIGKVRARSISSLLHQPALPTPTTTAAPDPFTSPSPAPATRPVTAAAPTALRH